MHLEEGVPFKLYIDVKEKTIKAVLTQEDKDREYVIAYFGRRLLDPETKVCPYREIMLVTLLRLC
jgi:hypothetical protein